MNAIRKILMPLLLIPFGMFLYVAIYPDWQWENPGLELLFAAVGIPILVVNFMAWFYPEILQAYFPVKEDWQLGKDKPVTLAAVISTVITFTCISVGAVFAITEVRTRPSPELSRAQPATATAFARSLQLLASATDSGESAMVSTPRPSLEVSLTPEETPQIPVSGGIATSSSTLSVSVTQAEVPSVSGVSTVSTVSTQPASTANPAGSCTPASPQYAEVILGVVQDANPDSEVLTSWMVRSNAAPDLWFVAAKIRMSETEVTLPGVWGLFVYPEDEFDIFSINDVAMDLSDAAWGEDSEPVLTMQSDGAQVAYDCAVQAQ